MKKTIIYLFILILQIVFSQSQSKKYSHTNKENNLFFIFSTFRHGARTHMFIYDTFGNFDLSIGKLTKYGEIQNLEIGKKYRERYSNFLNMNFDKNQMLIYASNWKRVIVSAEKQLEGFFNKKIDINIINEIDWGNNYINLYNLNEEEKQEIEKYSKFCRKKRKLDVDSDYRKMFKDEIEPILKDCYGTLFTISLHLFCDSVFPAYFQYKYGNDTKNKIGKCGKEKAQKMYEFCYNWYNTFKEWDEYGAYIFYIFYKNIFNYMNKSINGTSPVKMIMIGGHENTVDKFMNFLDGLNIIERTEYPQFAFNIVIELRKYNNDFYLEFYYNDILKYNKTLQDFQNILNNSKYSNLYNYCGVPPWKQNGNITKDSFNNQNENNEKDALNKQLIRNESIKNENIQREKYDKKDEQTDLIKDNQKNKTIEKENEEKNHKNENNNKTEDNIIKQNNLNQSKENYKYDKHDVESSDLNSINEQIHLKDVANGNRTESSFKTKLKKFFKQDNDLNLLIIMGGIIMTILIIIIFCLFIFLYKKRKNKFIHIEEEANREKTNNSMTTLHNIANI